MWWPSGARPRCPLRTSACGGGRCSAASTAPCRQPEGRRARLEGGLCFRPQAPHGMTVCGDVSSNLSCCRRSSAAEDGGQASQAGHVCGSWTSGWARRCSCYCEEPYHAAVTRGGGCGCSCWLHACTFSAADNGEGGCRPKPAGGVVLCGLKQQCTRKRRGGALHAASSPTRHRALQASSPGSACRAATPSLESALLETSNGVEHPAPPSHHITSSPAGGHTCLHGLCAPRSHTIPDWSGSCPNDLDIT